MNNFFISLSKTAPIAFDKKIKTLEIEEGYIFTSNQIEEDLRCKNLIIFGEILLPDDDSIQISTNKNIALFVYEQYVKNGIDFLKRIDGKFTILILEKERIQVFRDRVGSGPIVYYNHKFISNNLSLFREAGQDFQINNNSLHDFLRFGHIPSPNTIIDGIYKLAGGELLKIDLDGKIETLQLHSFQDFYENEGSLQISENEAIDELLFLHKKALKKRIKNQNNIGILLSGGFDSGGNLLNISQDYFKRDLTGISIGFKNHQLSEVEHAKLMADTFNVDFITYDIDGSEIFNIDDIVTQFGEPFFEGGLFLNYAVMKMASHNNHDVLIGGDGNDQTFGTGSIELGARYISNITFSGSILSLINKYDNAKINQSYNKLYKYLFYNRKIKGIFLNDDFGFNDAERYALLGIKAEDSISGLNRKNTKSLKKLFLQKSYYREILQVANEVIIKKASTMANMFGCNLQFPYVDLEFYNFIMKLPWQYRMNGSLIDFISGKAKSKYIFKQSLQPHLPKKIFSSKKQGGFTPLSIFFDNPHHLKYMDEQIRACKLFNDSQYINSFLQHCQKEIKNTKNWFWYRQSLGLKLFNLLFLARWYDVVYLKSTKK